VKLEFPERKSRPIGEAQLFMAREHARSSPRRRAILRYHEHDEPVQRMVNAIEPDSYIRPHKHEDPDKVEVFLVLRGSALLCVFDAEGNLVEHLETRAGGPCFGVEIPPGTWHSLLALEPGTVLYEILEGPYHESTHKSFAPWAPPEGTPDGIAYHHALRSKLGHDPEC
jgi:cupin fold WbuC family metalloprotein